jgi:hypothetical protein
MHPVDPIVEAARCDEVAAPLDQEQRSRRPSGASKGQTTTSRSAVPQVPHGPAGKLKLALEIRIEYNRGFNLLS